MKDAAHERGFVRGGRPEIREALDKTLRAAGRGRHALVAELALRLAHLGHVTEVRVSLAGGPEAAEAVRLVLAELAAPPQTAPAPGETALTGPVDARVGNGGSDALEPLPRRYRACSECGHDVRQGGRQAKRRVFCSVRCRVRHHRRARRDNRAENVQVVAVPDGSQNAPGILLR